MDLVCLVADKQMKAALSTLLGRHSELDIRPITKVILQHPYHDPGCFHNPMEILRGYRQRAEHALIVLDHAWDGVPAAYGAKLESLIEDKLERDGMKSWAVPVVIEPELEAWVFNTSPHVNTVIGWTDRSPALREALEKQGFWEPETHKPSDPKKALEWIIRTTRKRRSSSLYRELAQKVNTKGCQDRAFRRMKQVLHDWFPPNSSGQGMGGSHGPPKQDTSIVGHGVKTRKKLIEVALPLDAVNAASVREKSIRHGHPSTLHLWWARRPLAAARAVIFSQMVDDPSAHPDRFPTEKAQARERERLFGIIKKLVQWENTNDEKVLEQAREEIRESWLRTCTENADHPRAAELFDPDRLPAFHDPFAGGGALPLEAQRLGLEAHASDLNPVAVLINKAMIEIPPRFAGRAPVNPDAQAELARGGRWNGKGAQGLAEDVRYYGQWMRDEAEKRIGHLYPKIEVTAAMAAERPALERYVGRKLTVIAWLWARTVKSPNPAFAHVDVPLASTFMLSTKKGKEAYVEPVIEGSGYRFTVKDGAPDTGASKAGVTDTGASEAGVTEAGIPRNDAPESGVSKDGASGNAGVPPPSSSFPRKRESMRPENGVSREGTGVPPAQGTKLGRGANFRCLMSDAPIPGDYIKAEGRAGRMGARLMAIVAEGDRSRVYLAPSSEQEAAARKAAPAWRPEIEISGSTQYLGVKPYGMARFDQLFTPRQLVALTTFSDLVAEAMACVKRDTLEPRASGPLEHDVGRTPAHPGDDLPLRDAGTGATAYAEAVALYLAFALSKLADRGSTICTWFTERDSTRNTFARQSIPMTWDYAELNTLLTGTGSFLGAVGWTSESIGAVAVKYDSPVGSATQADAGNQLLRSDGVMSTDPPYYDNVPYADLSDFFYTWLRRTLQPNFPDLFATLAVPKTAELVSAPYRQGGRENAEKFFLNGMKKAIARLAEQAHPAFPVTIYYAFKQSETRSDGGTASTGWETFLAAVIEAGFSITGTWPTRTELANRMRGMRSNALASSIVLVCRRRSPDTPPTSRRDFLAALRSELPPALADLQKSNIAPVDFAQAAIGPGMAIFTRYARVLEADGSPMPVRSALVEINRMLDETLARQEGDLDPDTRFCVAWYEQYGVGERAYGEAEVLFSAKNTSFEGLQRAGVVVGGKGKVRLRRRDELDPDWNPATDRRITDWEGTQHLTRSLTAERGGGVGEAARLVLDMGAERAEKARALAYRLYSLAERKRWADEAHAYNILVTSWPQIQAEAARLAAGVPEQAGFGFPG